MVVLSKDVRDLPPEERLRALKLIEEQKKKELKRKQKELEELEKQKKKEAEEEKKELEEAERLIRDSIEDLAEEQEKAFKELEEAGRKKPQEESSLESLVEEAPKIKTKQYTAFLEQIREEATLYTLTNYNVYREVGKLREKVAKQGLDEHEEELLKHLKYKLEEAEENPVYRQRDRQESNYLARLSEAITQIETIQKDIDKRTKQTMYSSK